jgi:hypothetical protein
VTLRLDTASAAQMRTASLVLRNVALVEIDQSYAAFLEPTVEGGCVLRPDVDAINRVPFLNKRTDKCLNA